MRKKLLKAFLFLLGLGMIAFSVLVYIGFFEPKTAGILIETEPVSSVFIDGNLMGTTPYESSLKPAEILIQLVPKTENGFELNDYETKLDLEPGVKTIIKRSFNADNTQTSGALVSFEKIDNNVTLIALVTAPDASQMFVDGRAVGFSPLQIKTNPGEHQLVISSEGYMDKSLPIRAYKGYKLTAVVKLARNAVPETFSQPVLSETTQNLGEIEILRTDTGYLRVRGEPNTNSSVLGQVNEETKFEILEIDATDSWYKIEFENIVYGEEGGVPTKLQGWVSGEFVKLVSD